MLTPELKEHMMRATLTGRSLLLGLATQIDDAGIHPCRDAAYAPQAVVFGDPYEDGGEVKVDNVDDVLFAAWATDSPEPMPHYYVADDMGKVLVYGPLKRVIQPERGDTMRFWPGDLTVSLGDSEG